MKKLIWVQHRFCLNKVAPCSLLICLDQVILTRGIALVSLETEKSNLLECHESCHHGTCFSGNMFSKLDLSEKELGQEISITNQFSMSIYLH